MFTAVLFLIAKRWKQAQQPSADERTCLYSGMFFRNKKEQSTDTYNNMDEPWKHAKWKMPDRKGHSTFYVIPFMWHVQDRQVRRQKVDQWLPGARGRGVEWLPIRAGVLFDVDGNALKFEVMVTQLCEYTKKLLSKCYSISIMLLFFKYIIRTFSFRFSG